MAAKKYAKYIYEYDPKMFPKERRPVMAYMDNNLAKGSNFYLIHWILPGFGMQKEWEFKYAGHPPHIHKDAELLFHIGTDPDNPMDLGGAHDYADVLHLDTTEFYTFPLEAHQLPPTLDIHGVQPGSGAYRKILPANPAQGR
jgi:hypothetical protein